MSNEFEQISIKPGFMKHNGGVLFRNISETEYEFKSTINENHLNAANITHGGYLSALIDAGAGTAAHRASGNSPCVTISLDLCMTSLIVRAPNLSALKSFKEPLYVPIGVLKADVITTSSNFLLINYST